MHRTNYPEIERRENLSPLEFFQDYVGRKPIIFSKRVKDWEALKKWDEPYFYKLAGDQMIKVKVGDTSRKETTRILLRDYIKYILKAEKVSESLYLHDIPLPTILDALRHDMTPSPVDILPKWYRYKWWRNLFFFYGKKGSLTPMHFDNLGTHNLFFHIRGRKHFVIVDSKYLKNCYLHKYSFSQVDPISPDFDKFPLFKNVQPQQAILEPGDVLYMPPYTLHHVTSLETCMSVNVDWHTRRSALMWLPRVFKGMGPSRMLYNTIYIFGVVFGIPAKQLYPFYKHYMING